MGIKITYLDGTNYENGCKFGQSYADGIHEHSAKAFLGLDPLKEKLKARYPETYAEVQGRAAGAGADFDAYLSNICYEISGGCTDILRPGRLAHNEDDFYTLENIGLVRESLPGGRYLCYFVSPDCLAGAAFGWSDRLAWSTNFIDTDRFNYDGMPVWFVMRDLCVSESVAEIQEKLRRTSVMSGFSFNVTEVDSGRTWNIERYLDEENDLEVKSLYVHTNHILRMNVSQPAVAGSTLFRYNKTQELLAGLPSAPSDDEALKILGYSGVCRNNSIRDRGTDGHVTAATFLFAPGDIRIRSWLDKTEYRLSQDMSKIEKSPL